MAVDRTQLQTLIDIIGRETLVRVKESYIEDSQAKLIALGKAVAEKQLKEVDQLSHSLKSASANLALTSLADVFAQLELLSGQGQEEPLDALFEQANQEYQTALTELSNLL